MSEFGKFQDAQKVNCISILYFKQLKLKFYPKKSFR